MMKLTNVCLCLSHNRFVAFLIIFLCLSIGARAQNESSQYDRGTPPQHAAGISSVGSYISTDLGTINLTNGSLNFSIPLGQVGGRGFSLPINLNYSSKVWSANTGTEIVNDPTYRTYKASIAVYDSSEGGPDIYQRVAPGWTLGAAPMLRVRGVGINSVNNPNGCNEYISALTKLTVMLPDKGEIELRDDATDGSPLAASQVGPNNCRWMDGNRGQRWHATDGSGIIFISDETNGVVNGNLNGWLITADGMRYGFKDTITMPAGSVHLNEFARAESITDRNGNIIQIDYSANPLKVTYKDQLERTTTIEYGVTGSEWAVIVSVKGYAGASRQYKVKTGVMNANYRAGISPTLPVYNGWVVGMGGEEACGSTPSAGTNLFASWCGGAERIDNRPVLTQVVLPDDRLIQFRYNEYGEVAEVEMPTGGRVQYDYAYDANDGLPSGNSAGFEVIGPPGNVASIDRAVVARRTYPDGQTTGAAEAYWSYDYSATKGTNGAASNGVTEVTTRASDNSTVLLRQKHYFLDAARFVNATSGGTGYSLWSTGLERRTETLNAAGSSVISTGEQDWSQRAAVNWTTGYTQEQPANDNRVNESRKILETGQTARTTMLYDQFNNPTETSEFDFDNSLKRRTVTSFSSTNPVNGVNYVDDSIRLLRLPLQQSIYNGAGVEQARTITEYDIYTADGNHALMQSYSHPSGVSGHDTANYGTLRTARGNATSMGSWIKSSNTYLYTYPRYDMLGNVVSLKDARGNVSDISFEDDFGVGSNPGSLTYTPAKPTYALPTLITSPDAGNGSGRHTARSQYDFDTGLLTGFKDRNGIITQTIYEEGKFNRPVEVKSALGISGLENHSKIYYAPATAYGITLINNDVLTVKDQNTVGDHALRSWTRTDGFGRTVESWTRDPQGDVTVATNYDGLGRGKQTSNPFRPSLGESAAYTTTAYDLAGRVISVTTPDNAAVTSSYNGNQVTVTDQAGKVRRSLTGALGRLSRVDEPDASGNLGAVTSPNQPTSYSYDVLDNLITVSQGSQQRFFMYDSLKRLIRARNPEQETNSSLTLTDPQTGNSEWSMSYTYDNNGNLLTRTDARGVVSTYAYDALNRNTSVNYTNDPAATPTVNRYYDGWRDGTNNNIPNSKGRLWQTETTGASGSRTTTNSFDALGRPLSMSQQFRSGGVFGQAFTTGRAYNLASSLTGQTYPSGHTIAYGYNYAGQTSSFTGNLGDGVNRTYASGILYAALGGMTKEQFGTDSAVYHKRKYNIRGQLYDVRASNVNDDMGGELGALVNHYSNVWVHGGSGADNNGNVLMSQTIINSYMMEDRYSYDFLNRLTSVEEWQNGATKTGVQTYDYDRYGNRTINAAQTSGVGINNKQFTVNTANNRLGVPSGQTGTMAYDAAGNLVTDTYSGSGVTRVYDAENRMASETQANNFVAGAYVYNADGQRVRRTTAVSGPPSSVAETWQVYGMDGELLAEYAANAAATAPQKEYGYRNGELLITAEAGAVAPPSTQNVSWTNMVGVSAAGNSLTRTATGDSWGTAGAASTQQITSGDGYVEFTATETTSYRMLGLSNSDANQGYTEIDFGLHVATSGMLYVYESGTSVVASSYTTGDVLRVAVEGGVVKYRKNGTLIYTSTVTPTYPLLADTSLYTNGSTINNAVISGNLSGGSSEVSVSWANVVGVSTSGSSLTRTATGDNWGNAGASSTQTLASGDGYVEFTATETTSYRMLGLSYGDANQNYGEIDFAIYPAAGGTLYVYESGASLVATTYATGDKLRIAVEGGVVKYRKNGTLIYTSTVAPTYPLLVDTSLYTNGSTISNVVISNNSGGGSPAANINWLMTDHLGTPRMIIDKTGTLAGVKRHDYLPFGEELFAGVGGRTTAQGYSQPDNIRQKFAGSERDNESGLDFMQARYYSSTQGRFTSPDQPFMDQEEGDPQSWNLYSYVRNNPLNSIDPTGEAQWKDINGELHWVGDEDGEYDADLKASWVADENNPLGGYWDFAGDQSPVEVVRFLTPIERVARDGIEPPMGGGIRFVTRRAAPAIGRGIGGLLKRAWSKLRGVPAKEAAKGIDDLFKAGRTPKASEIAEWAKEQGWTARQTPNGPLKFIDENGVARVTIKKGSPRTPGSDFPHVELRNSAGKRIDPSGNQVTKRDPVGNHTPIQWDW